ncbi:Zinc finger, SWIM-type [Sesbania bispinosa]|nr:Zinc finger, SWIM-type [Sesbania bispinosa]
MDGILDWMNGKDIPMMDRDTSFWQEGSDEQSFIYASPSLVDQDGIDGFLVGEGDSCVVLVDADWDDNQNEGDKDTGYEEDHQNEGNGNTEHGEENRNEGHEYTEHEEEAQHKGDQDTEHEEENQNEGDENNEHEEVVISRIDSFEDIKKIDLVRFSPHEISHYDFASLDVAYLFYSWYGRMNGFATKKGKVISSRKIGRVLQQNFFCNKEGGYEKIGFRKKDIYNQIIKQRRLQNSDAESSVKYLHNLGVNDPLMFTHHTIDPDNRLEHLFWCEGQHQGVKISYITIFDVLSICGSEKWKMTFPPYMVNQYCKPIFKVLKVLQKATSMNVVACRDFYSYSLYTVYKRGRGAKAWNVSYNPSSNEFKCPCMWLESRGLPCVHTIAVLDHLNINELPKGLVLKRWTKGAKDNITSYNNGSGTWDSQRIFKRDALNDVYRKLSVVNSVTIEEYNDAMERSLKELAEKEAKRACDMVGGSEPTLSDHKRLRNPLPARHKGNVRASTSIGGLRIRRTTKCSICHVAGHNKATCPQRAQDGHTA